MSYDKNSIDGIERGVKVRFTGEGGYTEDNQRANKRLVTDDIYTVRDVNVHSFHSDVYLEGYEGSFNSVMFEVASEFFN